MSARLSLCMIVKNEEKHLARCLESVQGVADELIVVDTGSTDGTVALAEAYGAQVFHYAWQNDFALARNVGLERATGDWILHLDADEALEAGSRQRLRAALDQTAADGLLMVIRNFLPPGPGAAYDDFLHVRLFRNRPAYRYAASVHEQITPSILGAGGQLGVTDLQILHYGYIETTTQRDRNRHQRNIELLEQALAHAPQHAYLCAKLGLEYFLAGNSALAEAYLRRVVALPYHTLPVVLFQDVLLGLSQIAFEQADYVAAIERASACVELFGEGNRAWGAWNLLADAHLRLSQQDADALPKEVPAAAGERLASFLAHLEQAEANLRRLADNAELNAEGRASVEARLTQCAAAQQAVRRPLGQRAAATLQALLEAEDLPAALEVYGSHLDEALVTLVRLNGAAAAQAGDVALAEGLDALAKCIEARLASAPPVTAGGAHG